VQDLPCCLGIDGAKGGGDHRGKGSVLPTDTLRPQVHIVAQITHHWRTIWQIALQPAQFPIDDDLRLGWRKSTGALFPAEPRSPAAQISAPQGVARRVVERTDQRVGAFKRGRPAIMDIFAEIRRPQAIVPAQPSIVFPLLLLDLHQETPIREQHVAPMDHQDTAVAVPSDVSAVVWLLINKDEARAEAVLAPGTRRL
jgi:hypothetical protein